MSPSKNWRSNIPDEWTTTNVAFDVPCSEGTLRHNAYASGWERGAADGDPPLVWTERGDPEREPYRALFWEGFRKGKKARKKAWAHAATFIEVGQAGLNGWDEDPFGIGK